MRVKKIKKEGKPSPRNNKRKKPSSSGRSASDQYVALDRSAVLNQPTKPFKITHPIPKGIRVLMIYSGIITFFYLLLIFVSDITLFFGAVAKGTSARFIHFLFFVTTLLIVYGIAYKKSWCYHFSIVVYSLSILNTVLSFVFIGRITEVMITSLYSMLIPVFLVTLLMNVLTLWYVHEKKPYFSDPSHEHRHTVADDVFVYTIYLFFFFTFVFIVVLSSLFFINAANSISHAVAVTKDMEFADAQAYCEGIENQEGRDICFLSVVYTKDDVPDIDKLCSSISSSYYRFTCYRVIEG